MFGIITAFAIILVVIAVGYLLSRVGVIRGDTDRGVINRVAFYAAVPALVFSEVAQTQATDIFSPVIGVTFLATAVTAVLYCVISVIFLRRDIPTTASGAGSAVYVNAVNIGLPVMVYVIGHATFMAPIMVMQVLIFTPIMLAGLAAGGKGGQKVGVREIIQRSLLSPIVLASAAGLVFSLGPWEIPEPVLAPVSILGGAAIPLILMSFGASLGSTRVLESRPDRPSVLTATVIKLVGMPLIAWLLGLAFGLGTEELYAVVILAALPTAQNVYNFAATYDKGTIVARDTVFITTFAALPVMLAVALLFGR